MAYSKLGNFPIIPAADLLNLQSDANIGGFGNARVGTGSILGKRAGMRALRDGVLMVFATGAESSDVWRAADGAASYTPLNLSTWTVGADSTYSAGLITTDGGGDTAGTVIQTITALAAGTYIVSGVAAAEGTTGTHIAAELAITGSTTGALITKIFRTHFDAAAAESADPKEAFAFELVVPVAENVTFTIATVNASDADTAGSAYITIDALEAINA